MSAAFRPIQQCLNISKQNRIEHNRIEQHLHLSSLLLIYNQTNLDTCGVHRNKYILLLPPIIEEHNIII